jgi:glycosyltransferase involved in cell wall biosynthesis
MARVDVVVPCYNYGHFLTACIASALAQEGVYVNVLVVDDASTDHSAAIARAFAAEDSRVRLISLPTNVGMIPAVNRGIKEATGDYFVKLDADDLLPPGSLERSVALFERHPNVGFVYGRPRHFTDAVPRPRRRGRPRWAIWHGAEWFALRCQRGVNCISQPEAVIRMRTLRQVGEYNASLRHTSDLDMWLRLAAISDVGRINGIDQGYYRVHPNSMQRTVNAGLLADFIGRREAFVSALAFARDRLHGTADLEATVRAKLAAQALDCACRAYDRDRLDVVPVDALVEFAMATFVAARELPEWNALQWRKRRGRRSRWTPSCLASALLRRSREEVAYAYWLTTGV